MLSKRFLTILPLTMMICGGISARNVVDATEFGVYPDTYRNCVEEIRSAIDYCREHPSTTLRFQPGRYDIWPDGAVKKEVYISNTSSESQCPSKVKTFGILLDGLDDVEFDGNDARFIMHGEITNVGVHHSSDIVLKNFTIDYERPAGSELTYTSVSPGRVILDVHRDSRYDIRDSIVNIIGEGWRSNVIYCIKYSPGNEHYSYSNDWKVLGASKVRELAHNKLEFATPADFNPKVGDVLTLRDIIRTQVGMMLMESENITLDNLKMRYMHAIGIVGQSTRNITLRDVECAPDPASGRVMASSADCTHFSGCSGDIVIERCRFVGAQDDGINVHGTNLRIVERIDDRSVMARFMHHESYGFQVFWPGDTVAFVNPSTMQRESQAVVEDVETINPRNVRIKFTTSLPKEMVVDATCVENITRTPSLRVSDCYFSRILTRGVLCTTPRKVVIENNVFEHVGQSAVYISSDASNWYESGPVTDVTIRGNKIVDCGYNGGKDCGSIMLEPSNKLLDKRKPVHENILITSNEFASPGRPVLFAKSTRNIRFTGNRVIGYVPEFILKACDKVRISGNDMEKPVIERSN